MLMTGAFNASWGQGTSGSYGGNDEGLSAGETAAIAVGAALFVGSAWWFLAGGRRRRRRHTDDQKALAPVKDGNKSALRLVPSKELVEAGDREVFTLEALNADGKWVSVTDQDSATIELKDGEGVLVRQDGAKNSFCLPITTPASVDGQAVSVVGRYTTADGTDLQAQTTVRLHVGGDLALAH